MSCQSNLRFTVVFLVLSITLPCNAAIITTAGQPGQLDVRAAGEHSIRITLKPVTFKQKFPITPVIAEREYIDPSISIQEIDNSIKKQIGNLYVEVQTNPLKVTITNIESKLVQDVIFEEDGSLNFRLDGQPVLGLGEGGPQSGGNWRNQKIEFDRLGSLQEMIPRWQSEAYGSRNPVALMIGTGGWGLFIATPWGQIDLRDKERGRFIPWAPPDPPSENGQTNPRQSSQQRSRYTSQVQGRPPVDSIIPGVYDLFVFDAHEPANLMKDVSIISGPAVLPPKWSLGYMQSHRELTDANLDSEDLLLDVVDIFRKKSIPLDAVIYLGTGFTPTGWNTQQPSFDFNPKVFKRNPKEVLADLHKRNVKVIVHIVPWAENRLPTLHGTIPPREDEIIDDSHILSYWQQHVNLVKTGIDAWWPDEGDRFNLFERIKRHQLYYEGPLSTQTDIRPWSLHRNGYLGIAQWGGWIWSGDTMSTWKTLEGQIAVGINSSLSLSPFWGSDTGGFYTTAELTGELYARWFQFSAFCPSFRSHGRIWRMRLPWGWGLSDMGDLEGQREPPRTSELNNPAIEPVCKQYSELRYQLLPYTYTLAWQAHETGMPLMRAMWLHYHDDEKARGIGDQYLWGRDMLIAPVYTQGAITRDVYLPEGKWYDWWTNEEEKGGSTVTRKIDLKTMPIYVRAGAIIPFDPVRQYTSQPVTEATTIKVYRGSDGQFTLYEDDGVSLNYLKGSYTLTRMTWNDSEQRLTIEPDSQQGAVNLSANRTFKIVWLPEGTTRNITYTGKRTELKL